MASGIDCDSVKDAWQSCIELSALEVCPYLMQFRINTGGTGMSLLSLASAPAGIEIRSKDRCAVLLRGSTCLVQPDGARHRTQRRLDVNDTR
jgi:hypothetical protein